MPWHFATVGCKIVSFIEVFTQDLPDEFVTHFYIINTESDGDLLSGHRDQFPDIAELLANSQFELEFPDHPYSLQGSVAPQIYTDEECRQASAEASLQTGNEEDPIIIDETLPDLDTAQFPDHFDPAMGAMGWAPVSARPRPAAPVKKEVERDRSPPPRRPASPDHSTSVFNRGDKSGGRGGKAKGKVYLPASHKLSHDRHMNPLPYLDRIPDTPPYFRQLARIPGLLTPEDKDHPELVPGRRVREEFKCGFGDGQFHGWDEKTNAPVIATYPATRQWIDHPAGRNLLMNVYLVGHVSGQCSRAPPNILPEPFFDRGLHDKIAQVSIFNLV